MWIFADGEFINLNQAQSIEFTDDNIIVRYQNGQCLINRDKWGETNIIDLGRKLNHEVLTTLKRIN